MLGELGSGMFLIPNTYAKDFDVLEGAPLLRGFWTAFEIVIREARCSMALSLLRNLERKIGVDASDVEV
jgi:hypothetical protein